MTRFDDQQKFDAMLSRSMASLPVMEPSADFDAAVLGAVGFKSRTHWAVAGVMLCTAYAVLVGFLLYIAPWAGLQASAVKVLVSARPLIDIAVRVLSISISQLAAGPLPLMIPMSAMLALGFSSALVRHQPVRNSL